MYFFKKNLTMKSISLLIKKKKKQSQSEKRYDVYKNLNKIQNRIH